ncbi:MAG: hypothetical protein IH598_06975 [Bacteroidales bacterium]|nr:hypothetical protein [Bacteroidales bacterium]
MKTIDLLLLAVATILFTNAKAQDGGAMKATDYGILPAAISVPSIADQIAGGTFTGVDPNATPRLGQPKRSGANKTVPGKGLPKVVDQRVQDQKEVSRHRGKEPLLVFDANTSNITPSDPTGAIGPNHFVGAWNVGFRVFDKEGNPLTPTASLSTLFPGNNLGDPIVLYDKEADRFIITEFDSSPNGFNVAISKGPNPVTDGWWVYTTGFTTGSFPDYPKFSIWSDGYYVTANISSSNKSYVLERDKMLDGLTAKFVALPLPQIGTSGFYSPQAFNVTNGDLPPAGNGYIVYLQDDAWSSVTFDHLKIWTINVDWENTANSTISSPQLITTTPFISVFDGGSFSNRPQPSGPDQDILQATIMNQAQYRRFPDYNSVVFNFVVDILPTSAELAGIRWYELRQYGDGNPWEIFQEGTYTSPYGNKDAFSGSMAMDGFGNIGMGYTTVSSQEKIAIYYTGRLANDPPGVMTIDETLIAQSLSNNPSNRLADYVHLTVDPVDDMTFWHIAEYFKSNQRKDVVGVFQIASPLATDVGILSIDAPIDGALSEAEPVTVTLFNYGTDEQINIPMTFQVDAGEPVTEIFEGPLPGGESVQFTFEATANLGLVGQTYTITVTAELDGDLVPENDTLTKNVLFLPPDDIGVQAVVAPVSGSGMTAEEEITVLVENFGTNEQNSVTISYVLNGNTVTEQFESSLPMGEDSLFTFITLGNFMAVDVHELKAFTSLEGDFSPLNDTVTVLITNSMCQPQSDCTNGSGFQSLSVSDLSNISNCSPDGYGDFTTMIANMQRGETYDLVIETGIGDQYVTVWIDFNDNFLFEESEMIINNYSVETGQGIGNYTVTIPFNVPADASLGQHLMRTRMSWNEPVPDNSCVASPFGETEDYTVDISPTTGFTDKPVSDAEMSVIYLGNNQFEISLYNPQLKGALVFNVHNVLGHKLVENRIENVDGKYTYSLDMSYAEKGVYIVRFGSYTYGKVRRIQVY